MDKNFRQMLRRETLQDHQDVDRALSSLNVSRSEDFKVFLQIHLDCFQSLRKAAKKERRTYDVLSDFIERIQADLTSLRYEKRDRPCAGLGVIDPLALDYMVEGSRLGAQILRQRWRSSEDADVISASAYMSTSTAPEEWRSVCSQLAAVPCGGVRAGTIIEHTRKMFALFAASIEHQRSPKRQRRLICQ